MLQFIDEIFRYFGRNSVLCRTIRPALQGQTNINFTVMKISHIEHLGIAVTSIEEALPYYENVLGLKCYNIETVEDQKVKTAFLKVGEVKIELLEPTSPGQHHRQVHRKERRQGRHAPPGFRH